MNSKQNITRIIAKQASVSGSFAPNATKSRTGTQKATENTLTIMEN